VEDPLSEGGTWVPLTSLTPGTAQLQKNDGAFPEQAGHAGAHTTAAVPADQYSEIVVGNVAGPQDNVGPIVRVQTSGPSVDSHYLWWASTTAGVNGLYRIDATGTSYTYEKVITTSGVVNGDTLRLIARGPVLYGLKNGKLEFMYNPEAASFHYPTGSTGVLAYDGDGFLTNAKIASWSTGAAPVSSGRWASTNFAGTEDPLDEGDRWYPLPGYLGFSKQNGLAVSKTDAGHTGHNASGVWGINPPANQYSQVTLGTAGSGGGGPIVRIDRTANGLTGWLLLLWANDPTLSGIYKLSSYANGDPIFTGVASFPATPTIVAGDKWRLTANGNTLEVSRNGASQFTYTTDGSYASGDVGIEAYTSAFAFSGWEGGEDVDTQAPTAPANLTAKTISSSQVNLAWNASTDNIGVTGYRVERCQNANCTTFTQIASVTGTSYNDTGLAADKIYRYRVRATDAAGNLSDYSNVASANTDTTKPAAPTALTAMGTSSSQINLMWTASNDNVGVTGYIIERCQGIGCTFTQVATVPGSTLTYSDKNLAPTTAYSYRIRATDLAGNVSDYSNTASGLTLAAAGLGL
jgi:chitodextrinase